MDAKADEKWEPEGSTKIRVGNFEVEVTSYYPYDAQGEMELRDRILADHRDAQQFRAQRMCRMQGGPPIPWSIAEEIHKRYVELHGNIQSLERIHERGGFGWAEVQWMFTVKDRRQEPFKEAVAATEARANERVRVLEEALMNEPCPMHPRAEFRECHHVGERYVEVHWDEGFKDWIARSATVGKRGSLSAFARKELEYMLQRLLEPS